METAEIICWHIYHSGSAVLNKKNNTLHIFDYYKQKNDKFPEEWLQNQQIESTFIHVTHGHSDHYNPNIFRWQDMLPRVNYVLSSDLKNITKKFQKQADSLNFLQKGDNLVLADTEIQAFTSTDEGVSLLVKDKNLSIFFSGDLNWWAWKSFSEQERKREAREYKQVIDKLSTKKIDLAFVPVDPRLEENYYLAGEYFLEKVKPGVMVPIHMGDDYSIVSKFIDDHSVDNIQIAKINRPGQKFKFNL